VHYRFGRIGISIAGVGEGGVVRGFRIIRTALAVTRCGSSAGDAPILVPQLYAWLERCGSILRAVGHDVSSRIVPQCREQFWRGLPQRGCVVVRLPSTRWWAASGPGGRRLVFLSFGLVTGMTRMRAIHRYRGDRRREPADHFAVMSGGPSVSLRLRGPVHRDRAPPASARRPYSSGPHLPRPHPRRSMQHRRGFSPQ